MTDTLSYLSPPTPGLEQGVVKGVEAGGEAPQDLGLGSGVKSSTAGNPGGKESPC